MGFPPRSTAADIVPHSRRVADRWWARENGLDWRLRKIRMKGLFFLAVVFVCAAALSADQGRFVGKVVVEWLDDPFVSKMQLREDFGFEDSTGKLWLARQGQV